MVTIGYLFCADIRECHKRFNNSFGWFIIYLLTFQHIQFIDCDFWNSNSIAWFILWSTSKQIVFNTIYCHHIMIEWAEKKPIVSDAWQ